MVENIKISMLALQRLLRSMSKWSCGTAHIFWYIMDEHMYFWCHPGILCSVATHGLREWLMLSYQTFITFPNFNTHPLLFYQLLSSHQTFIILSNFCHLLALCYLFTVYVIFSSYKFTYCTHHKQLPFLSYRAHVLCANIPFLLTRSLWPSCHSAMGSHSD